MENEKKSVRIPLWPSAWTAIAAAALLMIAKHYGVIDWPTWAVTLPLWIVPAIGAAIVAGLALWFIVATVKDWIR